MSVELDFITPDWPAPDNVIALTTTRTGGVSQAPYTGLNLAAHVDDDAQAVQRNRKILQDSAKLPAPIYWLQQTHSTIAVAAGGPDTQEADASYTQQANTVCAVLTADCLPILLCNQAGDEVAAIHAGWRGLADGIIENTVHALQSVPSQLMAWFGPAIGGAVYEVGDEVRDYFLNLSPAASEAFNPSPAGRWLASLTQLATQRLQHLGIEQIYGGEHCTFSEPERFYSYRRDGQTGRIASLIYYR